MAHRLLVAIVALQCAVTRSQRIPGLMQNDGTEALPVLTGPRPDDVGFPDIGIASLTTCQASGTLVNRCIDSGMTIFSQSPGSIPPDPHGAVGPTTLVAVTNTQIESLYKDSGSTVFGPTPLEDMFSAAVPSFLFDPKIIYDVHQRRFVVVVLDRSDDGSTVTASRILIAVSKGAVPMTATASDWYFGVIDALVDDQYWADYPGLAVDEEAIYLTYNMYSATPPTTFEGSLLWIVAKEPFYSGGLPSVNVYDYVHEAGNTEYHGTHMPAMVRSAAGIAPNVGTYLVMYGGLSDGLNEYLSIIQVDNPLDGPSFRQALVAIGDVDITVGGLVDAPQKDPLGRGNSIAVNDRRALEALWVQNQLWVVATATDDSFETAALWVKLNANGVDFPPTFADSGIIPGENIAFGTSTFFPSLDVNSMGVAAFGFSASSGSIYPSAYAAIRDDRLDPAGTVRTPVLVKAGEAPYYITFSGSRNRWGDYSGMVLDPSNETCFWAFNEYAGRDTYTSAGGQYGSWKTAWARLCYSRTVPTTCRGLNKVCTKTAQCCQPSNKVCEGPVGTPKKCKVCLRRKAACARTTQCCPGLKCRSRKCL